MEYVEITVDIGRKADQAVLIYDADDKEVWIPFSLMEEDKSDFEEGEEGVNLNVAEWFATKEGLI